MLYIKNYNLASLYCFKPTLAVYLCSSYTPLVLQIRFPDENRKKIIMFFLLHITCLMSLHGQFQFCLDIFDEFP